MKRKAIVFSFVLATVSLCLNVSYGAFGTETWSATIITVACSGSGGGSISGNFDATGGGGSISGSGSVEFAHYAGKIKSCPGWAWGCYDAGAQPEIVSYIPISGCNPQ
tara:strand:+ start:924 stop:1247 length:324 start_codon:yes stop_codon:yes gene_type:complete